MSDAKLTTDMAVRALSFGSAVKISDSTVECLIRNGRRLVVFHDGSHERALGAVIRKHPLAIVNDVMRNIRNYYYAADGQVPVAPVNDINEDKEPIFFAEHIAWLSERGFDDLVFEVGASADGHAVAVFRFGNECKFAHMFPDSQHNRYQAANQAVALLVEAFVHELLVRFDELVAPAQRKLTAASATPSTRNKKRNLALALRPGS